MSRPFHICLLEMAAPGMNTVEVAQAVIPRDVGVRVRVDGWLVDGADFARQGSPHVCRHDIPIVIVGLVAVLASEEDTNHAVRLQLLFKLRHQVQVMLDLGALLIAERREGIVVVLEERRWIHGIVGEGVSRH